MKGIEYKGVLAGKGSALYNALSEGNNALAQKIYAETGARAVALLHKLAVPKLVVGTEGKNKGLWAIVAPDAEYDKSGRLVRLLNG